MIFINYRIDDSLDMVARLDGDLSQEFGAENVFRDKTALQAGQHWPDTLRNEVRSRPMTLVVIGPKWQTLQNPSGPRMGFLRLIDPDDWVRNEILVALKQAALDKKRAVIPILLHDTKMPDEAWLKNCGLEGVYSQQAARLRTDPDYKNDRDALVQLMRKLCPALPGPEEETTPVEAKRLWQIAAPYPLQPAPNFSGREQLLPELVGWAVPTTHHNQQRWWAQPTLRFLAKPGPTAAHGAVRKLTRPIRRFPQPNRGWRGSAPSPRQSDGNEGPPAAEKDVRNLQCATQLRRFGSIL